MDVLKCCAIECLWTQGAQLRPPKHSQNPENMFTEYHWVSLAEGRDVGGVYRQAARLRDKGSLHGCDMALVL